MSRKTLIIIASGLALLLVCCLASAGVVWWQLSAIFEEARMADVWSGTATPIPVIEREPVVTPAPPATTVPATTPPASADTGGQPDAVASPAPPKLAEPLPESLSTEQRLAQTILPFRDQRELAMRLRNHGEQIPEVVTTSPPQRQLDEQDTFWVTDNGATPPRQFEAKAYLRTIGDHAYWWVEDGMSVDLVDLERSAQQFDEHTYPTNREFFGTEWTPGVDGDPRVHVFLGNVPGVAGYFAAANSYSKLAEPYSNEREMFFINLRAMPPGTDYFDSVLAHEFQHMIHWYEDRNEDTWVNEGMSELATFINGYGPSNFMGAYTTVPDTQLNSWADSPNASMGHYGGSFLFMAYFLQRFGEDLTKAVVAAPENGIAGFNKTLADHGIDQTFDDIYADFLIANYLNDSTQGDGRWGYGDDLRPNPVAPEHQYSRYPVAQPSTVYQYGADYIELTGNGDLTLEFTGSTRVPVVDNQAHSGRMQWYSHRGDDSNPRLTRVVDLSGVASATLNYWIWYDIESDWDYGYVEISEDGGETWHILQTPHTATDNPSGNAYGPGYTGASEGWLEESIDLTPFAGQEVLLRFEYVTDDAVNRPGWTIDDISIPEIGFADDVENGDNGWQAEGFVRIDNVLPQHFLATLLEIAPDGTATATPLPLDNTNYASVTIAGLGTRLDRAVLIVSGLTPVTTEPAAYEYRITGE